MRRSRIIILPTSVNNKCVCVYWLARCVLTLEPRKDKLNEPIKSRGYGSEDRSFETEHRYNFKEQKIVGRLNSSSCRHPIHKLSLSQRACRHHFEGDCCGATPGVLSNSRHCLQRSWDQGWRQVVRAIVGFPPEYRCIWHCWQLTLGWARIIQARLERGQEDGLWRVHVHVDHAHIV